MNVHMGLFRFRTELMELEQKRDETQRKLNQVAEDLRRQKKDLESLPVS